MPALRLEFPFLQKDRWLGRAKRTVRFLTNPQLVNSYHAHTGPITSLVYLEEPKLLITSAADFTVRIWTLAGRYIGTLGSPLTWLPLKSNEPPSDIYPYRIPTDMKRMASSTTLKIFTGGCTEDPLSRLIALAKRKRDTENAELNKISEEHTVFGESIDDSKIDKHIHLPPREDVTTEQRFDENLSYRVPIYCHLNYYKGDIVETPKTPELLKKM